MPVKPQGNSPLTNNIANQKEIREPKFSTEHFEHFFDKLTPELNEEVPLIERPFFSGSKSVFDFKNVNSRKEAKNW